MVGTNGLKALEKPTERITTSKFITFTPWTIFFNVNIEPMDNVLSEAYLDL